MLNVVGFVLIIGCVFGSFLISGGKLEIILHALPFELIAIIGAAIGAFVVSNPLPTTKRAGKGLLRAFQDSRWGQKDYRDLLVLLFNLLSMYKQHAPTEIERHLDSPTESQLFSHYPRLLADQYLINYVCDYLRMMTTKFDDPYQLAVAMENEIHSHCAEELAPLAALRTMADSLPAIGIVAAVLGVIKTMGSLDQSVALLGGMIGGALVGTFLGVLLSYCFVGPLASKLAHIVEQDGKPVTIVKTAIVAYAHGLAPQVCLEIARRAIPSAYALTFLQLEAVLDDAKRQRVETLA